jgi:signal transduction histidine kinase
VAVPAGAPTNAEGPHRVMEVPMSSTSLSPFVDGDVRIPDPLFEGPGEMRARCRTFDWASTALGPSREWSQSLRTTVGILLASRNPMFLWWGPELIQVYNDAYRPSFGVEGRHPRALGMRGRECWTDIWDAIGPQIAQVLTTGEATWHENQYLPIERNGRLEDVWWTYSYGPVRDDDGRIRGCLVVCQETTQRVLIEREREQLLEDRRRAEEASRESATHFRTLFESLDAGFCVLELVTDDLGNVTDYRYVEANPAFGRLTGLTDAIGLLRSEVAAERPPSFWLETFARVARSGEPVRIEAPRDSSGVWLDVNAFRIGRPEEQRVAVLFTDVTQARAAAQERERLLHALEVERARLAFAFQQAPGFLAVLRGPEHVVELVNDAYYRLVGPRELVGRPVAEALPEAREQGFIQLLDRVLREGEPFVGREVPVRLARREGEAPEERFLDFIYLPLIEADGTRAGVIAHGTDVTDQVRARREIERLYGLEQHARTVVEEAYRLAEAANRAKSEFLAVMSHELRTPLNAIGGYAELLEMGIRGPVTEQQREDLHRIQASQRHLLGLINEVLNYAKLETGSVQYDLEEIDVRAALADAESLVAPQALAKGLTLVSADGPALRARADAEKLRQVLVNLLSNAVKFTERGGLVETSGAQVGDEVAIRVRDTGIGIPRDKLHTIFDPFVQVRADLTRRHEGTGLGLAISRDLARGMGGELTVESTTGVGSEFTLRLPSS